MRCIEACQLPENACAMWLAKPPKPPRCAGALPPDGLVVVVDVLEDELPE
jgi:hypothetical protein